MKNKNKKGKECLRLDLIKIFRKNELKPFVSPLKMIWNSKG